VFHVQYQSLSQTRFTIINAAPGPEINASLSPNVNFSPRTVIAGISATVRFVQKPRPTNNLSEAVDEVGWPTDRWLTIKRPNGGRLTKIRS
jgi:hypothetical protein